ncbi:SSI family serine proteinase inhibitor [Streptomyces sp. VRA16 Mangrove soil]|uniref:SSI family serine proteinase inhibitor n=1 Tax=Streptomyces sp. VRA16 Mangrove soil TaxID=2817434 RepID=UPI001A9D4A2F|nr:SSI family serine proteinase inhibitor [Streptomyces sp. VRA16 Mangrove soil]MBO1332374.1 protease inhibitor SIL-V5 [Streptomyces sp. VRA16 Mangrove soil]
MHPRHLAAAALLSLAAAVPTAHAADGPTDRPDLLLTVSGTEHTWIRGVLLSCEPEPSGHHPYAAEACAALDAAGGDLDAVRAEPHACTEEDDPVTASATGVHRGRTITWSRTFPNTCALDAATGSVFRF